MLTHPANWLSAFQALLRKCLGGLIYCPGGRTRRFAPTIFFMLFVCFMVYLFFRNGLVKNEPTDLRVVLTKVTVEVPAS